MVRLRKHPQGPELPQAALEKRFRSYVDMAIYAEASLPSGLYYSRNQQGGTLATALRLVRCKLSERNEPCLAGFWVEGRGNV